VEDPSYTIDMWLYFPEGIFVLIKRGPRKVPRTTLLHAWHFLKHKIQRDRAKADVEIQKTAAGQILPLLELVAHLPVSSGRAGCHRSVGTSSPSMQDPEAVQVQSSWTFGSRSFTLFSF